MLYIIILSLESYAHLCISSTCSKGAIILQQSSGHRRLTDRPCCCLQRTTSWVLWTWNWALRSKSVHRSTLSKKIRFIFPQPVIICRTKSESASFQSAMTSVCGHSTNTVDIHGDLLLIPQSLMVDLTLISFHSIW